MNPDNTAPIGDGQPYQETTPTHPDLPTTPDVAPVAAPTPAPATTRVNPAGLRALLVGIVAAVVVVALIVAGVAFAKTRATTPTADEILANAQKAKLQDATYSLTNHVALNLGGGSSTNAFPTTIDITGNGKLTTSPARNDVTVAIPLLGAQNTIEALTDGSDLYVNLGNLAGLLNTLGGLTGTPTAQPTPAPTANDKPWVKIPVGQPIPTFLDYSHLQGAKLIGTDKVNGKDTWHIQGTLNVAGLASATPNPGLSATATAIATQTGTSVTPVTEDLWFQQDTYFPAKFTVKVSANVGNLSSLMGGKASTATPTPGANSQATVDATVLFSAWNSGITITPPPASQVGDGSNLFPTPTPKK